MVKRSAKEMAFALLRFVPLIVCITLFAAYLLGGQDITAESILNGRRPTRGWPPYFCCCCMLQKASALSFRCWC